MKPSKDFNTSDVEAWCKAHIADACWSINENGEIDVNGNCEVVNFSEPVLPYKFGRVTGNFYAWCDPCKPSKMSLESLENCPVEVGGNFVVAGNKKLSTLNGGPSKVGGCYKCNNCDIHDLKGLAAEIDGGLYAFANPLEDIRELDKCRLGGLVDFDFCKLHKKGEMYGELEKAGRIASN